MIDECESYTIMYSDTIFNDQYIKGDQTVWEALQRAMTMANRIGLAGREIDKFNIEKVPWDFDPSDINEPERGDIKVIFTFKNKDARG